LWGKAQAFLESALKLAQDEPLRIRTHRALARLFEQIGEPDKAAEHYRASALAMNVV
jgi:HemY protein